MKRRDVIAGLSGLSLVSIAGCLGAIGVDEHSASPAGVSSDVREETGYEQTGVEELTIRREIEAAGYTEEVVVSNYLTNHEKTVDMGPLGDQKSAVFSVLTTPQVSLLGREFNPVGEMSSKELVDLVEDNYDEIENISHVADEELTILGQETVQSQFEADAQFNGQDVEVYLHVNESVEIGDDLLVTIGAYPKMRDEEAENIVALMQGVTEIGDDEGDGGAADGDSGENGDGAGEDGGSGSDSEGGNDNDGLV